MSAPNPRVLTELARVLAESGASLRPDKLAVASVFCGRRVASTKELSAVEAARLLRRVQDDPLFVDKALRQFHDAADPADAEGLPDAEEPVEPPAPVCTRGEPSAHDRAVIAEFGRQLEARQADRIAGAQLPPVDSTLPTVALEQAGPADPGEAGRRTHRPGGDGCETPAPVADHGPAAPPPVDVEAAAAAAVERFRARAGVIPDPPAREEIPPRQVMPFTSTGRYCLAVCYCGGCPHHRPIPGVDSREYRELVEVQLRKAAEKSERKKARGRW